MAVHRRLDERFRLAQALDCLAVVATATGQFSKTVEAFGESLRLRQAVGDRSDLADSLEGIAALAAAQQQPTQAIQFAGAAASIRDGSGSPCTPMRRTMLDQWLVPLQQTLGHDIVRPAWEAGRAMPLEQALQLAFATTQTPIQPDGPTPDSPRQRVTELSPREQPVAALLADGLTNRRLRSGWS